MNNPFPFTMESLTLPGSLESLSKVRDFVKQASKQAGLDKQSAYRLMLGVDEVVANIVLHGYQEAGLSGDVEVSAHIDDDALSITLIDSAQPYNPLDKPDPIDLDAPIEERQIGGLGVFLAKRGVDRLVYDFVDGHNRNRFIVKIGSADSAAS